MEQAQEKSILSRPWRPRSWKSFPKLPIASLMGSAVSITLALAALLLADDSLVDSWPIAPSVYLSIIAAISNMMVRFAFYESADLFWWTRMISGVSLHELHTIWDLTHNATSLAKLTHKGIRLQHLHLTAILVLLVAVTGPFLQRTITVEVTTRLSIHSQVELPVRREPMWNLTTKVINPRRRLFAPPPYQDEFAEVVLELNQRKPLTMSTPVCSPNATCDTNIVIAGFTWVCEKSQVSLVDLKTIDSLEYIQGTSCPRTGYTNLINRTDLEAQCGYYETDYQLNLQAINSYELSFEAPPLAYDGPQPGDMPWKSLDLAPSIWNYSNYIREEKTSDMLTLRQCNFSTSFVELSIRISDERVVTILPSDKDQSGLMSRNGIESIPMPVAGGFGSSEYQDLFTAGMKQAMVDLYGGYIFQDIRRDTMVSQGIGPRLYINQSSVERIDKPDLFGGMADWEYIYSMNDPLDDFLTTLDEISLRYALKSLSSNSERIEDNEKYIKNWLGFGEADARPLALPIMNTSFLARQVVPHMREGRTVAVYRAHYIYTTVAMSVTYVTGILILLLLDGVFSTHGRTFTTSPLEIARAFEAPLLQEFGANLTGAEISKVAAPLTFNIMYGELNKSCLSKTGTSSTDQEMSDDENENETVNGRERLAMQEHHRSEEAERGGAELVIDLEHQGSKGHPSLGIGKQDGVTAPTKGRLYM